MYVDDLLFVLRDPEDFVKLLVNKYKYRLKITGSIAFHLGCDFFRDKDGILFQAPKKYIEKMIDGYQNMFGEKPKTKYKFPLEGGDHPELDQSEFIDDTGTQKYQSLIG